MWSPINNVKLRLEYEFLLLFIDNQIIAYYCTYFIVLQVSYRSLK